MIIKFTINKWRKGDVNNNFNSSLSDYWRNHYYTMFKRW